MFKNVRASSVETHLVHHLVRLAGRDPGGYEVAVLPTGSVQILSPCGTAVYQLEGWVSIFMRHLHKGYFDAEPAVATEAAEVHGAGGAG